jgi:hypothetical protein
MSNLGRQWQQLDMYKTAKELRGSTLLDVEGAKVWDAGRTDPKQIDKDVMDQKLGESRATGLYDSIKAQGVSSPVYVTHNARFGQTVGDGHHRIAAAHDIDPNMLIPVEHG